MQQPVSYYNNLFENYLDGNVSADQANELFDFIKQYPEEARELMDAFREVDFSDRFRHLENMDAGTSRRMFDKLLTAVAPATGQNVQAPVHRVHFLKTSWFRYAAAVVLIAATSVTFLVLNSTDEKELVVSNSQHLQTEIGPGTNKAVLTLGDGSAIVLDEAKNGNLARQGNSKVVKLENGRLAYETERGAAEEIATNTLSVPRGGQYTLTLSDGTRVWLNAASSIKYPTAFAGAERVVEVTGEAYLEIAKNAKQPFIVRTKGTEILVLGTSFNVNAYADENAVRTTLINGSVKITKSSNAVAAMLLPGQQAETGGNTDGVKVGTVDTEQVLAWKNGFFSFNNADIKTIMRQLARWYDINIVYENGVPAQRFFGEMNRSLTLSQVLKGLEVTKVNFRLEGRNLVVMP